MAGESGATVAGRLVGSNWETSLTALEALERVQKAAGEIPAPKPSGRKGLCSGRASCVPSAEREGKRREAGRQDSAP